MDEPSRLVVVPELRKNGTAKLFGQLKDVLDAKLRGGGKAAVFSHPAPDPDAIGSQMGVAWLLNKAYGVDVDMFIEGEISHPQNLTMEKLLGPKLIPVDGCDPAAYAVRILVDTIPSNVRRKDIAFDVVVDHHVDVPVVNGEGYLFVNLHTGSCCGTVYSALNHYGVRFEEDVDQDQQVATALMVGIYTDTCGMLGDRFTEFDHEAYGALFPYRNAEWLKEIARYKRPRYWVTTKAAAVAEAHTDGNVTVVGVGMLSPKHRDLIADVAEEMLTWEGTNLSIAFALVGGDALQGSVRSMCASVSAAKLCQRLGEERGGGGWGHPAMGGYRFSLGGFAVGQDDDEETRAETWKLLNRREVQRIIRSLKK